MIGISPTLIGTLVAGIIPDAGGIVPVSSGALSNYLLLESLYSRPFMELVEVACKLLSVRVLMEVDSLCNKWDIGILLFYSLHLIIRIDRFKVTLNDDNR